MANKSERNPKIIAWGQRVKDHERGGYVPGNSLQIIDAAFSEGFDGIELDVQITADNIPILMHNPTVDKETNGQGQLKNLCLADLEKLSRGTWNGSDIKVATLQDALCRIQNRGDCILDMRPKAEDFPFISKAIKGSSFNENNLFLSVYRASSLEAARREFKNASVLLKTYLQPHEISLEWLDDAALDGFDGVMFQVRSGAPDFASLVSAAHDRKLSVTTFVHTSRMGASSFNCQIAYGVDYILSAIGGNKFE